MSNEDCPASTESSEFNYDGHDWQHVGISEESTTVVRYKCSLQICGKCGAARSIRFE